MSAGDDPCVFAELRQKPDRLVERAGPMIGERRGSFAIPSLLVGVLPFLVYPAGLSNAAPNGKNHRSLADPTTMDRPEDARKQKRRPPTKSIGAFYS